MIESMFGEGAFTPPVPGETPNDDNIVLNIDGLEIIINPKTRVSHLKFLLWGYVFLLYEEISACILIEGFLRAM